MTQQLYSGYSDKKKNKLKKALVIVLIIASVLIVGVWCVGLIAGSDSEERQNVSLAIEENTALKMQIEELTAQVRELQAQLDEVNAQIFTEVVPEETLAPDAPVPTEANGVQAQ